LALSFYGVFLDGDKPLIVQSSNEGRTKKIAVRNDGLRRAMLPANLEWPENCQPWKNNYHLDLCAVIRPARDSFLWTFLRVVALGTLSAKT